MKSIEMIPIEQLEGFTAEEFVVHPKYYDFLYVESAKELMEEAMKLADTINSICIAKITDHLGSYVLGESCVKGCSAKFILFNATNTNRIDAEYRAVTFNTGRGALTRYWYDRWVKFQRGSTC